MFYSFRCTSFSPLLLIPKCLTLLVTIVNGTVFIISFSIVYCSCIEIKPTFVLTLQPATLLNSFISSNSFFCVEYLGFPPYKKSYDKPRQCIFKKILLFWTKVHLVKAMVFPGVMYRCESWTIKKAEHRRIDASELWCWRRLLRSPWTARRSNQSILKEINPEYSLEGLILMLKFQYFGHLM